MRVYFSFPVSLARREACYSILSNQLKSVVSDTATLLWSHPMGYDKAMVTSCDIFVFRPAHNLWSVTFAELPSGVREELKLALRHNKSIYMVYTNQAGEDNMYKVEIDHQRGIITGLQGTSSEIYHEIRGEALAKARYPELPTQIKTVPKLSEDCIKKINYDPRLLLG